jgi:hypothetical protein
MAAFYKAVERAIRGAIAWRDEIKVPGKDRRILAALQPFVRRRAGGTRAGARRVTQKGVQSIHSNTTVILSLISCSICTTLKPCAAISFRKSES